jgi:hypothetical protein
MPKISQNAHQHRDEHMLTETSNKTSKTMFPLVLTISKSIVLGSKPYLQNLPSKSCLLATFKRPEYKQQRHLNFSKTIKKTPVDLPTLLMSKVIAVKPLMDNLEAIPCTSVRLPPIFEYGCTSTIALLLIWVVS